MTQKDGSPEASEGPYWSEELLAVLVVGLGDETQARDTLEGIIQQALSGRALQHSHQGSLRSQCRSHTPRLTTNARVAPMSLMWRIEARSTCGDCFFKYIC